MAGNGIEIEMLGSDGNPGSEGNPGSDSERSNARLMLSANASDGRLGNPGSEGNPGSDSERSNASEKLIANAMLGSDGSPGSEGNSGSDKLGKSHTARYSMRTLADGVPDEPVGPFNAALATGTTCEPMTTLAPSTCVCCVPISDAAPSAVSFKAALVEVM